MKINVNYPICEKSTAFTCYKYLFTHLTDSMSGTAGKAPGYRRNVDCPDCKQRMHVRPGTTSLTNSMECHRRQTGCRPSSSSSSSSSSSESLSSSSASSSSAPQNSSNDDNNEDNFHGDYTNYEDSYEDAIYAGSDDENKNEKTKEAEGIPVPIPLNQPLNGNRHAIYEF